MVTSFIPFTEKNWNLLDFISIECIVSFSYIKNNPNKCLHLQVAEIVALKILSHFPEHEFVAITPKTCC